LGDLKFIGEGKIILVDKLGLLELNRKEILEMSCFLVSSAVDFIGYFLQCFNESYGCESAAQGNHPFSKA